MAGDWIKFETVTPDKPEVWSIAADIDADPDAVIGKLVRIWIWADQQTIDGNAQSVTRSQIDYVARSKGFAEAMEKVGWLKDTKRGLVFSNFDRHNGKGAKKRAVTNRRVAKHRNADGVTKSVTREEKRREENNKKDKPNGLSKNKRKKSLPEDFVLTEERMFAAINHWNAHQRLDLTERVEEIFEQFTNHALANGKTFVDWDRAWQTWYSNAIKFERVPHETGQRNYQSKSERADEAFFAKYPELRT